MKSNHFKFVIPGLELKKAVDKQGNQVMRVSGVASTSDEDTDKEFLDPNGFDLSYFKKQGFVNWNHVKTPEAIIGEPVQVEVTKDGKFYVEADLYPDSKLAQDTYELAKVLSKNSGSRKLGWSIEGKAIERDLLNPKKVTKAMITGVAITPTPKNGNTWLDIVKGEGDIITPDQYEYEKEEDGTITLGNHKPENGGSYYLLDVQKPNGDRIVVDIDFNIKIIGKSLMATQGSGVALKRESLEGDLKYPQEVVKSLTILAKSFEKGLIGESVISKVRDRFSK
jgi:hypothetical protein